jgi:hypothetical protein
VDTFETFTEEPSPGRSLEIELTGSTYAPAE